MHRLPSVPMPPAADSRKTENFLNKEIEKLSSRLNAKNIVSLAKRFNDYKQGGHLGGQESLKAIELTKRLESRSTLTPGQPRNIGAFKSIQPLTDFDSLPIDPMLSRSRMSQSGIQGLHVKSFSGSYMKEKELKYKMVATKGHYEHTTQVRLPDPFKKHFLSFETHKKWKMEQNIQTSTLKTKLMKQRSEEYTKKKQLIETYQEAFGITLTLTEQDKLFKQLDDHGLEIVLKKKLAEKKQFLSAQTIQSRFRGYICRKWYKRVHEIRTVVAIKIQRLWRSYYTSAVLPRRQAQRERAVVPIIQKACRGYLDRRGVHQQRMELKADETYEYFQQVGEKLRVDTGRFIRYYADKWFKRVRAK